jgi:hypothetical protein
MTLTADWLFERVRDYFAAKDIATPVVYGSEQDGRHPNTTTSVVVGLEAEGEITAAGAPGAPGMREVETGFSSRSIFTDRAGIAVWIRGVYDPTTAAADRVRASQAICKALLHHVLAALYEAAQGSSSIGDGAKYKWTKPEHADAYNGALLKLSFRVDIPVEYQRRPRVRLNKPSAPTITDVNPALDQEACDSTHCEPVTSTE